MSNLPVVFQISEIEKMAVAFAKSQMFGAKTPEQAMALLLLAHGEGLHPAIAMRDFDVIQGRPAKKAEAMLRSFIGAGGSVEWHQLDDTCADATFSHPQGGKARITWNMERAKQAGLYAKDMYKKYPRQMLRSRCVSEGCRTVFPASTSGLHVPEEIQDMPRGEKDITPTAGYLAAQPADKQLIINETAQEVKALFANDQAADGYALIENSGFDAEEMIALWSLLPSNIRSAHKRMKEAEMAHNAGVISPAKHKRLEALIKEQKLDRAALKKWCSEQFGVDSFPKLNDEQYKRLDDHIASLTTTAPPPASPSVSSPADGSQPGGGTSFQDDDDAKLTAEQVKELLATCEQCGVKPERVLLQAKVKTAADILQSDFDGAIRWVKKQAKA